MYTRRVAAAIGFRLLATPMLLLSGVQAMIVTVAASPTAQEAANGGPWTMGIIANTGPGAHFVVTSEQGDFIGECTVEPTQRYGCVVDVPSDRISLVWEDLDSIPDGLIPLKNPIVFDPMTYETGPHNIGASFQNVPDDGTVTTDTSISSAGSAAPMPTPTNKPSADTAGTKSLEIQSQSCSNAEGRCWSEVGTRFTVTTEDGESLGECTIEQSSDPKPTPCTIPVPVGTVVIVTEDVSTITSGFAPVSNPIRFDTGVAPTPDCDDCPWGPTFRNGPKLDDVDVSGTTQDLAIVSATDDVGAHYTVTTEDGESIGECTIEELGMGWPTHCKVSVPLGVVVVVTEDMDTIAAGLAPVSNPIRFDTGVEYFDHCAPCPWGPMFWNRETVSATQSDADQSGSGPESGEFVRDVSIVPFDTRNNVAVDGMCVQIVGVSEVTCDDDCNGEVDFHGVPIGGPYDVYIPNLPSNMFLADAGRHITDEPWRDPLVFEAIVGFRSSGNTSSHAELTGC